VKPQKLHALLGHPDLQWILIRVRRRMEQGEPIGDTVRNHRPTGAERAAFERLFGQVTRGSGVTASLGELGRMLREADICTGVEQAVVELTGPVRNRRAEQRDVQAAWETLFAQAMAESDQRPEVLGWLEEIRATGLVRRLSGGNPATARDLLKNAVQCARLLPAEGILLAELAAAVTRDSHALDAGAPLGTLVVRLAAALGGVGQWESAAQRRTAWDGAGVICDELSAPLLVLNLPALPDNFTGRMLMLHAAAGEPCRLSLRQLRRAPPRFDLAGRDVFVCENPAIVAAAADRLGNDGKPLLCTEGQARTAARLLLDLLHQAGATLHYHGDFDWAGIRMGNLMARRHGALPWRYGSRDYHAAPKGLSLRGAPVDAIWDGELCAAMRSDGRAVHEEGVAGRLLDDLRQAFSR
jgi:uncharacterized protein (TIGR02679 family)